MGLLRAHVRLLLLKMSTRTLIVPTTYLYLGVEVTKPRPNGKIIDLALVNLLTVAKKSGRRKHHYAGPAPMALRDK